MSSHREAPGISFDPAADNTDVYAFVSPDKPDTVTLIANYVPLEDPNGGPNFFEFSDEVLYEIHVSNRGDARADISFQFEFTSELTNENTFLYNTGPIESLDSKNWNRRQFFSMRKVDRRGGRFDGVDNVPCPPCNIGPASTPDYTKLVADAIHTTKLGGKVFAGQRAEGFYVDLGAVFDLGTLRPFQNLNAFNGMPAADGRNSTALKNIHTIALQIPKNHLSRSFDDPESPESVIGVWATAKRKRVRLIDTPKQGETFDLGPFKQVSRLANPLFNEVLVPLARKDYWNSQEPKDDEQFADLVAKPELAQLLPVLYPGAFPNLDKLNKSGKPRADLDAILLTGLPAGVVPGFQNFTGKTKADLLRLNMAIPPAKEPSNLGLVGGDPAGFPNGRRVFDDTTTIELRAIAGTTYALIDKNYQPDDAAGAITEGLTSSNTDMTANNTVNYLPEFPYLGTPHSGYSVPR